MARRAKLFGIAQFIEWQTEPKSRRGCIGEIFCRPYLFVSPTDPTRQRIFEWRAKEIETDILTPFIRKSRLRALALQAKQYAESASREAGASEKSWHDLEDCVKNAKNVFAKPLDDKGEPLLGKGRVIDNRFLSEARRECKWCADNGIDLSELDRERGNLWALIAHVIKAMPSRSREVEQLFRGVSEIAKHTRHRQMDGDLDYLLERYLPFGHRAFMP